METTGHPEIARAASIVSAATLASRILGFVRDMLIARTFGAGLATDAFFVAFRFPSTLRELLGEGALSAAFIPVFTECLTRKGLQAARALARKALTLGALALAGAAAGGILLAPWLVRIMAPGFAGIPEKLQLTIHLTRLMFPYILFVGLAALLMGMLNSAGHFLTPALSPVMLNLAMIAATLFLPDHLAVPIVALALGVLVGGLGQVLLQVPPALRRGFSLTPRLDVADPDLQRIRRLMAPAVAGLSVTQVNLFIGSFLASFLPQGSISHLTYAFRLIQFPIGVFGVALAAPLLPALSGAAAQGRGEDFSRTLQVTVRTGLLIAVGTTAGLLVYARPIVHVLFEGGRFTPADSEATAWVLRLYSVGLCGYISNRLLVPAYYARHDVRTPVRFGMAAVAANAAFSVVLMWPLGAGGLALSTALASGANLAQLVTGLRRRGDLGRGGAGRGFGIFLGRLLLAAAALALTATLLLAVVPPAGGSGFAGKAALLLLEVGVAGGVYLGTAHLLGCEEIRRIWRAMWSRPRKPGIL